MSSRTAWIVLGIAAVTAISGSSARAAGPLVDPSGETMCLLYYKLAKQPAPLDDFAAQATSVKSANEFDRQKAQDAEKARLAALIASLASVSVIRVNVDMDMGQYDSDLGEYDLSGFSPNEYVPFSCFGGHQVELRFDNAANAQSWALDPKSAEVALKRNGGGRSVVAVTTVDLTGVDSSAPGDPMVLVGNVSAVSVVGEFNQAPLGHYAVKGQ